MLLATMLAKKRVALIRELLEHRLLMRNHDRIDARRAVRSIGALKVVRLPEAKLVAILEAYRDGLRRDLPNGGTGGSGLPGSAPRRIDVVASTGARDGMQAVVDHCLHRLESDLARGSGLTAGEVEALVARAWPVIDSWC